MPLVLADLVASKLVLDVNNQNKVFKFRHKDRCMQSLFWTLHKTLDTGKRAVLVMDKTEDLEKLNYLLSKHGLQQLSLIIQDEQNFDASFWMSRFRDDWMQKNKIAERNTEQDTLGLQLEDLQGQQNEDYNKLHQRKLFPKSVVEINDMISIGKSKRIDTSAKLLSPIFNYLDYQAKKATYEEAENLYDPKFRYCAQTNPFNKETIRQVSQSALSSMLAEMKAKGQSILDKLKTFEKLIADDQSKKYKTDLTKLKEDIYHVNKMLIKASPLTETEVAKQLFFQKQLFESLDIPIDPPNDADGLDEGFERIQQAAEVKLNSSFVKIQSELEDYLQKLTPANTAHPNLKPLIMEVNAFGKEIEELDLFKNFEIQKSVSFAYQKKNLENIIAQLEYGRYFIYEHTTYLDWLAFEERLTSEDKLIIDYLSKQDGFWGQEFELLFLEYFISYTKSSVSSVERTSQQFSEKLSDFIKGYNALVISNQAVAQGYIKNLSANSWESFLGNSAQELSEAYPLLIVSSEFYRLHSAKMTPAVDCFFFFNEIPRTIQNEEWLSNIFVGHDAYFQDLADKAAEVLPDQVVIEANHSTINRSFDYLSLSDKNRGASYLGQLMSTIQRKARIYQTKHLSIISYWSKAKNANLISELEELGIKEIMSDSENFNLIPGLLADTEKLRYILIEDGYFDNAGQINFAEQQLLKEDLLTAGVKLRSLDNFELISNNQRGLTKIINELTQAKPVEDFVEYS